MTRQEVYAAIDTERDYQDSKWGDSLSSDREPTAEQPAGSRTIDEFILYVAGYVAEVVSVASHFGGAANKLDALRKVAGLCVACFEQHGCPPREVK